MKYIVVLSALMLAKLTLAAEHHVVIRCSSPNDADSKSLVIWAQDDALEPLGQASIESYHSINLICPNAAVLVNLGRDVQCVGIDEMPQATSSVFLTEIKATKTGYVWAHLACKTRSQ